MFAYPDFGSQHRSSYGSGTLDANADGEQRRVCAVRYDSDANAWIISGIVIITEYRRGMIEIRGSRKRDEALRRKEVAE
jgi:hypothetical protein